MRPNNGALHQIMRGMSGCWVAMEAVAVVALGMVVLMRGWICCVADRGLGKAAKVGERERAVIY